MDWNNVSIRGVALKTLKGNTFITKKKYYTFGIPLVLSRLIPYWVNEVHTSCQFSYSDYTFLSRSVHSE